MNGDSTPGWKSYPMGFVGWIIAGMGFHIGWAIIAAIVEFVASHMK